MPNADHSLLRQLSENSRRYRDPVAAVDWSRLDGGGFWLPEPALSLYGLPEYDMLAVDVRRRLSQYEFINVMHAGLWLERVFMQRISQPLSAQLEPAVYEYFLHEMREESGHSLMFLRAIERSGLEVPAGAWQPPRLADWLARRAPAGGTLFWAATVIAEDVPDKFSFVQIAIFYIDLFRRFGNPPSASYVYVAYAVVLLRQFEQVQLGCRVGRMALELAEKERPSKTLYSVRFVYFP